MDQVPIPVLVLVFILATSICYEIGFRAGRWWQKRMPGEQEGPSSALVGALLGLMAFLLAVTMGMAADRFDARRGLVLDDANAITKAYQEADYLPAQQADELKELLREYVPLRIATNDTAQLEANIQRSSDLQQQMWTIVAQAASSGYLSDLMSSLGDSVTDLRAMTESRVVASIYNRVPETILLLLLLGSVISLGIVGYSAGVDGRRSIVSAAILIIALGAVITLVVDLDRPREGFLQVSQQPLIDVQTWMGPPRSP